jgi:hypothetical protein
MPIQGVEQAVEDSLSCATTVAGLLFLAEKFPHRHLNSAELSIICGIGRTCDVADQERAGHPILAWQVHHATARFVAG